VRLTVPASNTRSAGSEHDRRTLFEAKPDQFDLFFQCRQVAHAGRTPGAATEQHQRIGRQLWRRQLSATRKRPEILEADTAAFQVVFHQAEVLAGRVLDHRDDVHCRLATSGELEGVGSAAAVTHGWLSARGHSRSTP
jgi:hypothetical protein